MTTLRELFKKTKKATKETTDKILDADIEKAAKKTAEASGKIAKKTTVFLLTLFVSGIVILIVSIIFYSFFASFYEQYWCNKKTNEVFADINIFKSMDKREVISLEKEWFEKDCYSKVKIPEFSEEELKDWSTNNKYYYWKKTFEFNK